MDNKMIFNEVEYEFKFLNNSKEVMENYGMTIEDVKTAFFEVEDQKEYFKMLDVEDSVNFTFDDLYDRTMVIEKEGNIIKILKVF